MEEFANGATQVTVRLKNGAVIPGVLISDSTYPIAARGYEDLPFALHEIDNIYQTADDRSPSQRDGWVFWDKWK
jgi:hypothetical protein